MRCSRGCKGLENILTGYICYLGPIYLALLFLLNLSESQESAHPYSGRKERDSLGLWCTIASLSRMLYHPNSIFQLLWAGTLGRDVVSGFPKLTETCGTGLAILMKPSTICLSRHEVQLPCGM